MMPCTPITQYMDTVMGQCMPCWVLCKRGPEALSQCKTDCPEFYEKHFTQTAEPSTSQSVDITDPSNLMPARILSSDFTTTPSPPPPSSAEMTTPSRLLEVIRTTESGVVTDMEAPQDNMTVMMLGIALGVIVLLLILLLVLHLAKKSRGTYNVLIIIKQYFTRQEVHTSPAGEPMVVVVDKQPPAIDRSPDVQTFMTPPRSTAT